MYIQIVFYIVSVSAVCVADDSNRCEGCEGLMLCLAPLNSFQSADFPSISHLCDDGQYNQLCRENADFKSCFAARKDGCDNSTILIRINSSAQVLDYLCSVEGKRGLKSVADSMCVTDQTTLQAAQESAGECTQNFLLAISGSDESEDMCSYFDQQNSCMDSSLTNLCGQAFGTLVMKIWKIGYKPIAEQWGCIMNVRQIRHVHNRIIPLLLAEAKRKR